MFGSASASAQIPDGRASISSTIYTIYILLYSYILNIDVAAQVEPQAAQPFASRDLPLSATLPLPAHGIRRELMNASEMRRVRKRRQLQRLLREVSAKDLMCQRLGVSWTKAVLPRCICHFCSFVHSEQPPQQKPTLRSTGLVLGILVSTSGRPADNMCRLRPNGGRPAEGSVRLGWYCSVGKDKNSPR